MCNRPHTTKQTTAVLDAGAQAHRAPPVRRGYAFAAGLAVALSATVASAQPELRISHQASEIGVADVFDLGEVRLYEEEHVQFAIENFGDASLELIGTPRVAISERTGGDVADFRAEVATSEIAPGGVAMLDLWFTPSSRGDREIEISVQSNDPTTPDYVFDLWASGVAPLINVSLDRVTIAEGETVDLGELFEDEVLEVELIVENHGNAQLMLGGSDDPEHVQIQEFTDGSSDDFQAILQAALISPGDSAPLLIVFDPSSAGQRVVELIIPTNDPDHERYSFRLEVLVHEVDGEELLDCNGNSVADSTDVASGSSADCDNDGRPDECQADSDQDGVIDACDRCPGEDDSINTDSDVVPDCVDNCPSVANDSQADQDGDGIGDACDDDPSTPDDEPDDDGDDGSGGDDDGQGDDDDNGDDDGDGNGDSDSPQDEDGDDQSPGGNGGFFGFCGAGGMGLLPLTMLGLLGMRYRRGR